MSLYSVTCKTWITWECGGYNRTGLENGAESYWNYFNIIDKIWIVWKNEPIIERGETLKHFCRVLISIYLQASHPFLRKWILVLYCLWRSLLYFHVPIFEWTSFSSTHALSNIFMTFVRSATLCTNVDESMRGITPLVKYCQLEIRCLPLLKVILQ